MATLDPKLILLAYRPDVVTMSGQSAALQVADHTVRGGADTYYADFATAMQAFLSKSKTPTAVIGAAEWHTRGTQQFAADETLAHYIVPRSHLVGENMNIMDAVVPTAVAEEPSIRRAGDTPTDLDLADLTQYIESAASQESTGPPINRRWPEHTAFEAR